MRTSMKNLEEEYVGVNINDKGISGGKPAKRTCKRVMVLPGDVYGNYTIIKEVEPFIYNNTTGGKKSRVRGFLCRHVDGRIAKVAYPNLIHSRNRVLKKRTSSTTSSHKGWWLQSHYANLPTGLEGIRVKTPMGTGAIFKELYNSFVIDMDDDIVVRRNFSKQLVKLLED